VFVELAMHRKQFETRNIDAETFGRTVQQCSQRYRKILQTACRSMASAAATAESIPADDEQAVKENMTFGMALMLWELYEIFYCRKPPVAVTQHLVVDAKTS
jgi:hypothetical protein